MSDSNQSFLATITQISSTVTHTVVHRTPYLLTIAGLGGLAFVWVQVLAGTTNIATFVGQRIVETGGYDSSLASPIGWTVHLAIALQYAVAFAAVLALPIWPRRNLARGVAQIVAAVAIGFVATWVANPAISVTVSVLGGAGWPESLYPVNTKFGVPLWNHIGFFIATLAITDWLPTRLEKGSGLFSVASGERSVPLTPAVTG
ncbi:MAG: hypothetical protein AAF745_15170 [Planctomycetota bacterium]